MSCNDDSRFENNYRRRLENTSILFVGDSLTYQQSDELKCWLPWLNLSFIYKRHFFEAGKPSRHQTGPNPINYSKEPDFFTSAREFDYLVLNTGHHIDVASRLPNQINDTSLNIFYKTFTSLRTFLPKLDTTTVIWRTLSPRHYVSREWNQNGTCVNTSEPGHFPAADLMNGYIVPIVNAFAREVFRDYHILDVEEVSRSRGDAHCGTDCTHFIFPGPQHVWNMMLLDFIVEKLPK